MGQQPMGQQPMGQQPMGQQPMGQQPIMMPQPIKPFPVMMVVLLALGIPGAICGLGIMAAVAIPAFTRYVKRSKTSEATRNISMIYQSEVSYFNLTSERGVGQFISAGATPEAAPTAMKFPANTVAWTSDPRWSALSFSIAQPHYYQYRVTATGAGANATFTVTAIGDLDGDGIYSTFSRTASLVNGEIVGSNFEITNELE